MELPGIEVEAALAVSILGELPVEVLVVQKNLLAKSLIHVPLEHFLLELGILKSHYL